MQDKEERKTRQTIATKLDDFLQVICPIIVKERDNIEELYSYAWRGKLKEFNKTLEKIVG